MSYDSNHDISVLNGHHLVSVSGLEANSDRVIFECADGSKWQMVHERDCCENVTVEDVIGDVSDLQDAKVIDAREETSDADPSDYTNTDEYRESFTWTFYVIQTNKGAVTIRWLGESNGYYSEDVDFECVNEATT